MLPGDRKRLRQLEEENAELKKPVADLNLDKRIAQDMLIKNSKSCISNRSTAASGANA